MTFRLTQLHIYHEMKMIQLAIMNFFGLIYDTLENKIDFLFKMDNLKMYFIT